MAFSSTAFSRFSLADLDGNYFLRPDRILGAFVISVDSVCETFNADSPAQVRFEIDMDGRLERNVQLIDVFTNQNYERLESHYRNCGQAQPKSQHMFTHLSRVVPFSSADSTNIISTQAKDNLQMLLDMLDSEGDVKLDSEEDECDDDISTLTPASVTALDVEEAHQQLESLHQKYEKSISQTPVTSTQRKLNMSQAQQQRLVALSNQKQDDPSFTSPNKFSNIESSLSAYNINPQVPCDIDGDGKSISPIIADPPSYCSGGSTRSKRSSSAGSLRPIMRPPRQTPHASARDNFKLYEQEFTSHV